MKSRFRRYQAFRKKFKKSIRFVVNQELNPLGITNRPQYSKTMLFIAKLPKKWNDRYMAYRDRQINEYYTESIQGGDGNMYSPADMDDMMLNPR